MKKLVILALSTLILIGCSEKIDHVITKDNIELDIDELLNQASTSREKINFLLTFNSMVAGPDSLAAFFKTKNPAREVSQMVSGADYFFNIKKLQNHYIENDVTFRNVFAEYDSIEKVEIRYNPLFNSLFFLIDSVCQSKQDSIDNEMKIAKANADELENSISAKIVSVKKYESNYRDKLSIGVEVSKNTQKTVDAVSFQICGFDKLNNQIFEQNLKITETLEPKSVYYWTFTEYEANYDKIKYINSENLRYETKVLKISIDGTVLMPEVARLMVDFLSTFFGSYNRPDLLIGECVHLDSNYQYLVQLEDLKLQRSEERIRIAPNVSSFEKTLSDLF